MDTVDIFAAYAYAYGRILTVSICDLTQVSVYLSRIRHGLTMPETEDKQEF